MFDALHPRRFRSQNPEAVGIGCLFVFLGVVQLWTTAVAYGSAQFSTPLPGWETWLLAYGSFATRVLGFGLAALVYVVVRRLDVPTALPGGRPLLGAVATPTALVACVALVADVAAGTSLAVLSQRSYSPTVGLPFLVRTTLLPAAFSALGSGVLLFGVVQTRLGDLTTPDHAVVLAPVVVAVFAHLPMATLSTGRLDAASFALFASSVLVSVGVGLAVGVGYRGVVRDGLEPVLRWAYAPVLVVGAFGLLSVVYDLIRSPTAVVSVSWLVVVAVAAVAYARTRSVWTPVATLFAYRLAVGVVIFLEIHAGLAPSP